MALRVLLADESSTIKKVMQLALQDFGVEVKAVPLGVDVVQVAKSYKPDIVFADVLLAKLNGYEVSKAVKSDPALKNIPVVLMWSSFMELDEAKARESMAEHRLEKPFDAEALRSLVRDLVPATKENLISQFLSFPDLPHIIESEAPKSSEAPKNSEAPGKKQTPSPRLPPASTEPETNILMDLEEPEEFQAVPLPKNREKADGKKITPSGPSKDDWSHQDLSRYKIDLMADDLTSGEFRYDESDLTNTSIALTSGFEDISLDQIGEEPMEKAIKTPTIGNSLDPQHAEEILRQEARKVLETIAWKLLPDVVERVVREELQKLLKDAERL